MLSIRSLFGDDAVVLRDQNFQLLLLANLVGPLGTTLLSPVLDSLIGPFGATPANIGLMISFFTAPAIVMIPVVGVLADRFTRKTVLVISLTIFGAAGAAIALTTDYHVVLALRTIQGIAFGGLTPIIITTIGDLYTGTKETAAQGFRFTGSGISLTAFPLLAGILIGFAWQYPFLIHLIALPIAAAILFWFKEPSQAALFVSDNDGRSSYRRTLLQLIREQRVAVMLVARGLGTMVWTGFLTYNSVIVVRVIGGTPGQAGVLVALASASFAGASSQAGRLTAVFDSRLYPLVAANGALGVGMALVLAAPGILVAVGGIVVLGIGFGIALSLYRSIVTGLAPQSLRGGLVSISEASGRVMDTLTPIAMGGIIAVTTPIVGFVSAVQLAGLCIAVVGCGGGILCLFILSASPSVDTEKYEFVG